MHALCWPGHGDDVASTASGSICMSLLLGRSPLGQASLRLRESYHLTIRKIFRPLLRVPVFVTWSRAGLCEFPAGGCLASGSPAKRGHTPARLCRGESLESTLQKQDGGITSSAGAGLRIARDTHLSTLIKSSVVRSLNELICSICLSNMTSSSFSIFLLIRARCAGEVLEFSKAFSSSFFVSSISFLTFHRF